jgi:hypothetical protein
MSEAMIIIVEAAMVILPDKRRELAPQADLD